MSTAEQSTLLPAGIGAALANDLGVLMLVLLGCVAVLMIGLGIYAVRTGRIATASRAWLIGGGLILPISILTVIFVRATTASHVMAPGLAADVLHVTVTARQWWWEIRYAGGLSQPSVTLANELHLPVGRTVLVELTSDDVIHSFWVPSLAGKMDMLPGRVTRLVMEPTREGVFRGQCAEFCGLQHATMAFLVVVESAGEFQRWLTRQALPALPPADPVLLQGQRSFFAAGCQRCHTVRGTPAAGRWGPDLTHVGSRRSLGAGLVDNHLGTMGAWIAGSQDLKPGNLMPPETSLSGRDFRALAAWLSSLQ